jgi:long-chain acyl-CoA synthetase
VNPKTPARPGRVAARLARQVELGLASVDLTLSQYRILILLVEGKEAASSLADKLAVSRPSVTAVVDGLVARGLVERHTDSVDRRRVSHDITTDGAQALARADAAVDARLAMIVGAAGPDVAAAAFGGLESWRTVLESYRACKAGAVESEIAKTATAKAVTLKAGANKAVAAAR